MVEEKAALRKMIRSRLLALDASEKDTRSTVLVNEVKKHLAVSGAKVVALFSPLRDEVPLWSLVEELSSTMLVVLPKVQGETMDFYCYSPEAMECGAFGIMEPAGDARAVMPFEIDAVVVPGVAFTKDGARMGRGKGFYDKYLSKNEFRALKIGVCFKEQVLDGLPVEPHDVKMDVVIYV